MAPTTIGAITKGSVCTLLKNAFKGNELSSDNANKKPRVNSIAKVTTANLIDRQTDSIKKLSKTNSL